MTAQVVGHPGTALLVLLPGAAARHAVLQPFRLAARRPRSRVLRPATVPSSSFTGVRADAFSRLRESVITAPR